MLDGKKDAPYFNSRYVMFWMEVSCDKGLKHDPISLPALNDTLNISHDITIFLTWTGLTEFHFLLPSNTA